MREQVFIVQHGVHMRRLFAWLGQLTFERGWKITVERLNPKARVDQEAVLRGKERTIALETDNDAEAVHDRMLAMHYGTERIELGEGRFWERPARRTRTGKNPLSQDEMRDHILFVEAFAARELGLNLKGRHE